MPASNMPWKNCGYRPSDTEACRLEVDGQIGAKEHPNQRAHPWHPRLDPGVRKCSMQAVGQRLGGVLQLRVCIWGEQLQDSEPGCGGQRVP